MRRKDTMTSRERVLAVLRGEPGDRLVVSFDLGPFKERLRHMGIEDPEVHFGVDIKKIWFVPGSDEIKPPLSGPRIGNSQQVANYRQWGYDPARVDRRLPLIDANSMDDLAAYRFPVMQADDVARLRRMVTADQARGFAVAGQIPHLGGVLFETAYRLRGLDNLLEDFRLRPEFAAALLDRITDVACRNVRELAATGVDLVILGDDIGTPTSMLVSPDMWRQWLRPRLSRIIRAAREISPGAAIVYHSDGFFLPVITDLIDIGVGVLNPVQPDCMNPAEVRRRFGDALVLWGTVGSATLLPYGTPQAIEREVRLRVETVGRSGRLILSPAYDLEDNVPFENAMAFLEGCRSAGSGSRPGCEG